MKSNRLLRVLSAFILASFPFSHAALAMEESPYNTSTTDSPSAERAYESARPQWAVQASGSTSGLGNREFTTASGDANAISAFEFSAEYQPAFLQSLGVIGIGPSMSIDPPTQAGTQATDLSSAWSVGGQIRYQAKFWSNQWLVPNATYSVERFAYRDRGSDVGSFIAQGPSVGISLLLNALSPESGREVFHDYGLARTYMTVEYRNITSNSNVVALDGSAFYWGLRFEF